MIGLVLRGYRVDELLSRGKASALYKATQLSVARPVALKVLDPGLARKRETLAAFVRDARSAGKLRHPGVVEIHEVCQEGRYIFYTMEFLPGGSLGERIQRHGALAWASVFPMLSSAADALHYAEQRGIVHGNLDPGHFLFTKDDRLKVLNLGFAGPSPGKLEATEKQSLYRLAFLSPEQFRDGVRNHLTDIYSLACTFRHALTGRIPFAARTIREMLEAKLRGSAAPGRSLGPSPSRAPPAEPEPVPDWAGSLLEAMMAPDPRERCPSFRVVLDVLESRGKVSPRPRPRKPDAAGAPAVPAPGAGALQRAPRTLLAAAIGVLLVVATAAAYFFWPESPEPPSKGAPSRDLALEVKEILDGWESRRLATPEAAGALERLILEHPDPEARALLAPHLERMRAAAREIEEGHARERAARLEEETAAAGDEVARGNFGRAVTRLETLEGKFPESSEAVKRALAAARAAAKAELERVGEECQELARAGDFVQAALRLEDLSSRLPGDLAASAQERMASLKDARAAAERETLARAERAVRARLADLDFEGGLEILADLPETSLPEAGARVAGLESLLGQSQRLWKSVGSAPLPEWKDLASRFKEAVRGGPEIVSFERFKSALLETALRLYAGRLRGRALEALFRGRVKLQGDLALEVSYDFSRDDQLEDLVPAAGGAGAIAIKGGKLSLRGEYRLFGGNPFRDRLGVSFTAADFQGDAPNLNVALWTREGDRVTHRSGEAHEPSNAEPEGQIPGASGYLVLGLGYQPENALSPSLKAPEAGLPILFPCVALIHQPHGTRLHGDLRWSCLWGESMLQRLKKPQEVTIRVQPGSVEWTLGKESLSGRSSPRAREALQEILAPGMLGSVTIFSNGQTVVLSSLKVLGDLDPGWIEGRLRTRALKDLKEKAPDIPWSDLEAGR